MTTVLRRSRTDNAPRREIGPVRKAGACQTRLVNNNNAAVAVRWAKTGRRSERHRSTTRRTSRANGEPHQRLPSRGFRNGRRAILSTSANGRGKMIFAARHPATDIREGPRDGPCLRAFLSASAHLSRYKQFDICMSTVFAPTAVHDPAKDLGPLRP